jgi:hypothetical protein
LPQQALHTVLVHTSNLLKVSDGGRGEGGGWGGGGGTAKFPQNVVGVVRVGGGEVAIVVVTTPHPVPSILIIVFERKRTPDGGKNHADAAKSNHCNSGACARAVYAWAVWFKKVSLKIDEIFLSVSKF